jgi:uncharacterized cupredoxin-like copper-binding protein
MRHALSLLLALLLFGLTVAAKEETVEVVLDEYTIEMPHELPPGPTTFVLRNAGQKTHSFKIVGPGLDVMLDASVRPKATQSLQVTLQPGEYDVVCPIGSHAAKGMAMKLVVAVRPRG